MTWTLHEDDVFNILPSLEADSVDLIILDPPYNIRKAGWDCIGSHEEYLQFIKRVMVESERVLKDNGSLYLWHNQFLVLCDFQELIKRETSFIFKQLLIWEKFETNKQYYGRNFLMGFNSTHKRNYHKMCEYLLFYTFQDETGLNQVLKQDGFYNLMAYFREERLKLGWNYKQCDNFLGIKASYCYWDKPTTHPYRIPEETHYKKLQTTGYFQRDYEDLRREYEDLRYTFNPEVDTSTVWLFPPERKEGHITPKSVDLTEKIIRHSSNPGDTVLIPFAGSGSEMIAGVNLNRDVVGVEREPEYCQLIRNRLQEVTSQQRLEVPVDV